MKNSLMTVSFIWHMMGYMLDQLLLQVWCWLKLSLIDWLLIDYPLLQWWFNCVLIDQKPMNRFENVKFVYAIISKMVHGRMEWTWAIYTPYICQILLKKGNIAKNAPRRYIEPTYAKYGWTSQTGSQICLPGSWVVSLCIVEQNGQKFGPFEWYIQSTYAKYGWKSQILLKTHLRNCAM